MDHSENCIHGITVGLQFLFFVFSSVLSYTSIITMTVAAGVREDTCCSSFMTDTGNCENVMLKVGGSQF